MIPVDMVPISQALRNRIRDWNAWYSKAARPWSKQDRYDYELHRLNAVDIARWVAAELPDWIIVAVDHRVDSDGNVWERVAFPGEDGGIPFLQWMSGYQARFGQ
jgi:CYTH domain-containing protein